MYHNYAQISEKIMFRQEFRGNSAHGRYFRPGEVPGTGQLSADEVEVYRASVAEAAEAGYNIYVVLSYGTPIAWQWEVGGDYLTDGRAHVVAQRFSRTTSRLQNLVASRFRALAHVQHV